MTCSYAAEELAVRGEIPPAGSLAWALICPVIKAARGFPLKSHLTCPVLPEHPDHYGCLDGVRNESAERYDSFNGAGAWQWCVTNNVMP